MHDPEGANGRVRQVSLLQTPRNRRNKRNCSPLQTDIQPSTYLCT